MISQSLSRELFTVTRLSQPRDGHTSSGSSKSQSNVTARTRTPVDHKVLVVDDDASFRSTLVETVRAWGYRTAEASTLAETFAIVERDKPAALLLDSGLPDNSGITALDELKTRSPQTIVIFVTKPIDQAKLQSMLEHALRRPKVSPTQKKGPTKRGRPRQQTAAPLGQLVLSSMKLLGLSYKDIVFESERLGEIHNNPDMRIGKSTLGNIISGSIRQPGTAKLDALRIILNLSRQEIDASLGLQPERQLTEQLKMPRPRTRELGGESVMRDRQVKIPLVRDNARLQDTQFLEGALKEWATVDVEYLSSFYPPHLGYVVIGEDDTNASPIAPPGSRVLVNKLLREVTPAENLSFHERALFYVLTPRGPTCVYLEYASDEMIVLVPHPLSGNVREVFSFEEVTIMGQVVGVLYPE